MSLMHNRHDRYQSGSSMLEVMIALFVLAIGLLGFIGLQTQGITMGRQAYMHSQAMFLAQDLVERVRANSRDSAIQNLYAVGYGETPTSASNCGTGNCSPTQLANWDRTEWRTLVGQTLPGGLGEVIVTDTGAAVEVTVNIRYQLALGKLNPEEATPTDEESTYTFTLETQI